MIAIKPAEITSVLKKQIQGFDAKTELKEVGYVLQVGDGIARVWGLENAVAGELLEFPHGVTAMIKWFEGLGKKKISRQGESWFPCQTRG